MYPRTSRLAEVWWQYPGARLMANQEPKTSDYWQPSQESLRKYMVKMEGWRQWDAGLSTAKQIIRDLRTLPPENIKDNNINWQHLVRLVGEEQARQELGMPTPTQPQQMTLFEEE